MPNYKYTAKTLDGKNIRGTMRANDEGDLHRRLRENDLFVLSSKCTDKALGEKRLKATDLSDFCQQLGTMLAAGITLVRALAIMSNEEGLKPRRKRIYEAIMIELRQGIPLSTAMENCGNAFQTLIINIIRPAEGSGGIDKTGVRMATHLEKEHKLKKKVQRAKVHTSAVLLLAVS